MADEMKIEILPDGQIKIQTDEVSPMNHRSADELLRFLQELAGGTVKETKRPHGHKHVATRVKAGR